MHTIPEPVTSENTRLTAIPEIQPIWIYFAEYHYAGFHTEYAGGTIREILLTFTSIGKLWLPNPLSFSFTAHGPTLITGKT